MPAKPNLRKEEALRKAHIKQMGQLRSSVLRTVEAHFNASPDYRDEDIDRLVKRLLPIVQAGQLKTAQLTSVYLARQAALMFGTPYEAADVDTDEIKNLRGVPPKEVYRRPANTLYTALSAGKDLKAAKAEGLNRLLKIVATDLQMAKVHQADKSLRLSGAKYFRRTLSGSENCVICEAASKYYYKTGSLADIHTGCDCGVEPMRESDAMSIKAQRAATMARNKRQKKIYSAADERVRADGQIISPDGSTRAAVFEDLAVSVHSETGPTLHWKQHSFTTAADLK